MELLISCALDGRDLAVVKSILNIKNEYHGTVFTFHEDARTCDLLIAKDYLDEGAVYYALNRQSGHKTPILPNLNPKSLRAMFTGLGLKCQDKQSTSEMDILKPFPQLLMEYQQAHNNSCLKVESPTETWVFDQQNNLIHGHKKARAEDIVAVAGEATDKTISTCDIPTKNEFAKTTKMDLCCWDAGLSLDHSLLLPLIQAQKPKFKLISWPDYGHFPFDQPFIILSSIIWKTALSYDELMEHRVAEAAVVNRFLCAALLAGFVTLVTSTDSADNTPDLATKSNGFLSNLKKALGFK